MQSWVDIFAVDLMIIIIMAIMIIMIIIMIIMLADRTLIYYTFFSRFDFKNNNKIILIYIKMGEALNIYPNLRNQTKFRLKTINEIKDCLITDIRERSNE